MKQKRFYIETNPATSDETSKLTWSKCYICKKTLPVCDTDYYITEEPYNGITSDKDYCSPLCIELGIIKLMR